MNQTPPARPAALAALAALAAGIMIALAGCSAGSDGASVLATTTTAARSTSSSPTSAPAPTAQATSSGASSPEASSDSRACTRTVDADSSNAALQEAATAVFDALDCGSSTTLDDQLTAQFEAPAFTSQASAAGWDISLDTVDVGAGSMVLSMIDLSTRSSCQVQVITSPRIVGLLCGDV